MIKKYIILKIFLLSITMHLFAQNYVGIKVQGNQNYCVGSSAIPIATNVDANLETYNKETGDNDLVNVTIAIEDALPGDFLLFESTDKGVSFTQDIHYKVNDKADFKAKFTNFIQKIEFNTTGTILGTRHIKVKVNHKNYLDKTNHFYTYVQKDSRYDWMYWTGAKDEAENRTENYGLIGYLVTITSARENQFVFDLIENKPQSHSSYAAWIGASDKDEEGKWIWMTGPEKGNTINWENWLPNEPNNKGSWVIGYENYACMQYEQGSSQWNDLRHNGGGYGVYRYIAEYGGMPEDFPVVMQAAVTIHVLPKVQPQGIYFNE